MNKLYRIISIITVLSVLISLCSCVKPSKLTEITTQPAGISEQTYTPIEEIKMSLPYINGDTINPFYATSEINSNLTSLLYDSLYAVGNDFKAIPLIAQSSTVQNNSITVTIKSGLTFTDGSFITAADIAYSFNIAKDCSRYSNDLKFFNEASALNNYDVSFTFNERRADLENLLTFPIIKSQPETDSADTESSVPKSEDTFIIPIGSGRYLLKRDKNNSNYLTCNTSRLGGYYPLYRNIGLVAVADSEKLNSLYSLGKINVLSDIYTTGDFSQVLGTSVKMTTPNFIYLVCNTNNSIFQDKNIKKAISYAINREEICNYCFIGNAEATELPFPSSYYATQAIKSENKNHNDAISLLTGSGYEGINEVYNFRYNKDDTSKVLEFRLAVCNSNKFKVQTAEKIKEQLAKVNIRVEINQYNEVDFFNVLSTGGYDMYIGECKMKNNLDLSSFFINGNTLCSGINANCDSAVQYNSYSSGQADINSFIKTFKEDFPFIPLVYRTGNIYSNDLMGVADTSIITDMYYNIENWKTVND